MKDTNQFPREEQVLARTNANGQPNGAWIKPRLSQTPLRDALSGGRGLLDGTLQLLSS
jgi:hypothetical protein